LDGHFPKKFVFSPIFPPMAGPAYAEFEKLFKLHHKALHDLAYNLVKDRDVAKDIIQEVFLKLWQNRDRLDLGDQIKHYLFKATSHTALNHLRSSKRMISADQADLSFLHAAADRDDLHYKEFELRVRESIDRLPPKCKVIFLMSRHEGMKYQQIADALDISIKTVENQMGIALEKLRDDLKPYLPPALIWAILALMGLLWYLLQ
jgi:RNA polymerase sigma-70 factor, ECF subfamily